MLRWLLAMALASLSSSSFGQTANSSQTGTIGAIAVWSLPGGVPDSPAWVTFQMTGAITNPRSCQQSGLWVIVLNNATSRAMYAALLAAKASGTVVSVTSLGTGVDAAGGVACLAAAGGFQVIVHNFLVS